MVDINFYLCHTSGSGMKYKIFILFLSFSYFSASAQNSRNHLILGSKYNLGFNIPVYKALGYLIEDDINSVELTVSFQATGKNYSEKLFNYPRTGFGYSGWTLGNNRILGKANALYCFINVPVKPYQGKFTINLQTSAGAAYLNRKFDMTENPLNRAIGSNYNIYMRMGVEGRLKVLRQFELVTEAGMSHFSNGKTRSPNYGINTATLSFGANYIFNQENFTRSDPEIPAVDKRNIHSIFISAGPKVFDNLYGYRYMSATVSYNIERYLNNIGKAGVGADLFYDGSIGEALSENGVREDDFIKLLRAGVHVSYALRYNRFNAGLQAGFYVYSKYIVLTSIYNKIFVQYTMSRNITANISVRSHWGKADCMEYGIGYVW